MDDNSLKEYILECMDDNVNEGIIRNAISSAMLRSMDPEDVKTGLLNMYDYIVDGVEINKFYKDYPLRQRIFWKTLVKMYAENILGIFDCDVDSNSYLNIKEVFSAELGVIEVTPELRRELRAIIKGSRSPRGARTHDAYFDREFGTSTENNKRDRKRAEADDDDFELNKDKASDSVLNQTVSTVKKMGKKTAAYLSKLRDRQAERMAKIDRDFMRESQEDINEAGRGSDKDKVVKIQKNEFKFSDPLYVMPVEDTIDKSRAFILTINKQADGIKKKIMNMNAKSFLENVFLKIMDADSVI